MKKNENMISFVLGIISAVLSGLTFLIILFFAGLTEDGGLGFQSMLVILGLVFNILSLVWANSNTKKMRFGLIVSGILYLFGGGFFAIINAILAIIAGCVVKVNKKDELKFNVMDKTIDLGSIVKGK